MRQPRPKPPTRLRHDAQQRVPARATTPAAGVPDEPSLERSRAAAREPDDEHAPQGSAEAGFRASSYDLKKGLDVIELPTSLPADVLHRLFGSRR